MRNSLTGWRVEAYDRPHLSIWSMLFALILLVAAALWCVPGIRAGEPIMSGRSAGAADERAHRVPGAAPSPRSIREIDLTRSGHDVE